MQRVWSIYLDSFGSNQGHKQSDSSHQVRNAAGPDTSTYTFIETFNLPFSHFHLFFPPNSLDGSYVGARPICSYPDTHPRAASTRDRPQWLLTPIHHIHLQAPHVIFSVI